MYSILKYTLRDEGTQAVEMPLGSEILSVESQGDDIVLFASVKPQEESKMVYEIKVFTTGQEISLNLTNYRFIGTVNMHGGAFIFHVYVSR
jgi:hypothetical protein